MTPGYVRVHSKDGTRSAICREYDGKCYVYFNAKQEGPFTSQEALKRAAEVVNG